MDGRTLSVPQASLNEALAMVGDIKNKIASGNNSAAALSIMQITPKGGMFMKMMKKTWLVLLVLMLLCPQAWAAAYHDAPPSEVLEHLNRNPA